MVRADDSFFLDTSMLPLAYFNRSNGAKLLPVAEKGLLVEEDVYLALVVMNPNWNTFDWRVCLDKSNERRIFMAELRRGIRRRTDKEYKYKYWGSSGTVLLRQSTLQLTVSRRLSAESPWSSRPIEWPIDKLDEEEIYSLDDNVKQFMQTNAPEFVRTMLLDLIQLFG